MTGFSRRVVIGVALTVATALAHDAYAERFRCASRDYRYAFCDARGRVVSARVARKYSKRPCIQNFSWGFERDGIWVDDGCDADFDVVVRGGGPGGGPGGGYDPRPPFRPPPTANPAPWAIGEWRGGGYQFTVYRGGSVVLARGGRYERGFMQGDNITLQDGTRIDADPQRGGMRLQWPGGRSLNLRREREFDYR